MSVDTFVFLRDDRLPSRAEWQTALDIEDACITLDTVDDLREFSGYWPAKFDGHDSGFEWLYGPVADTFGELPEGAGDRRHAVDFVTHSDMRELVCALFAAGVLAKLADGLFFDEESASLVSGERAIEIARLIAEAEL